MTDNKKYIINVGDQSEMWDSDMLAEKGDALYAKYKDANVFEVEDVDDFDEDPTDHQYVVSVGEESEIWDADMVKQKGSKLKEAYPDAMIQRVSYQDYWGDRAKANREQRALLAQPNEERNARLAELGYYDDMTGEANAYTQSEEGVPQFGPSIGLKPLSSVVSQNPVTGLTTYSDPTVQEFFADDTYADTQAEIARLDAEYESNPSVIAQREYEAQWRADQAKYNDTLEAQIRKDAEADGMGDAQRRQNRKMAPMLGMGNPMLVAQYNAMYADAELPTKQSENYASALNMMEKIKELQKVSEKGFGGATLDVAKEKFESWREPDIALYNRVGDILTNLEAEFKDKGLTPENLTPEVLEQHLSNDEKALILAFFQYNSALEDAQQDMSAWYKGGKIFAESVPFMLEFLATGGLYKAAGSAATKGMAGALKKWVLGAAKGSVKRTLRKGAAVALRDLVYAGVGTLARTVVSPGTYNRMAEESVKIEDGHLDRTKNVFKSFADSYIENLSEISGGLIGKGLGLIGKGIGKGASMAGISFSKLGSMLADNRLMQTISSGWKSVAPKFEALGFHGIFEEVGEEYIGNAIRELTIQPGALAEMHKDGNFGAMLIGFAPMTLFGGAVSAVTIGARNIEAANLGNKLRETLGVHYSEEQVEHMMNLVSGAENAEEIWEAVKPLTAGLNAEETQQLLQYGAFMAQNKAMLFARQAQEDNLAQAKRAQLQQTYNKFWQENAEGVESVQLASLNDGRTVFVVSEPTADGVVSIIDASTGAKGFTNVSNYKTEEVDGAAVPMTQTWSMDAYLEGEIASERRTAEGARMEREYNEQVKNLQSQIKEGTRINLGTEGNPVIMLATGQFVKDGVIAVDQAGNSHTIGWNQVADAMQQPIGVKTDQQIIDEEIAAVVARNAERRKGMSNATPAMTEAVDESAVQTSEAVALESRHIPMNEDGTVNEAAFWEQDPEGYVQWNDEQNQDGGADSLQQIGITKAVLASLLAEAQQAQQTTNPAERKAAKQRAQEIAEKIDRLTAIEASYAEQRLAPLRERAMRWKGLTNAPVHIVETEEELASISGQAAESSRGGVRVRGFAKDGRAYIYLPGIVEESEIDAVFMHEAVAHTGLKGLLGQEQFDELCDQVWEMMSPKMQQFFINYPGVNGNTRAAADEYIAHIAEAMGAGVATEEEKTVWQQIIDFVRNVLRSIGITLNVSESELSDLIHMAYADLAKNMAEAEEIAAQQKEARAAEQNAPSAARQEYNTYAEDLTHDEIKAVAENDFTAAQQAYDALVGSAPRVEAGESAKDFIARKKAYNEKVAEAKAALDARQALMDEIARIDAENAPVLTDAELLERDGLGVDLQNDDVRMSVRYVPTEKQREMIIGSIMNVTGRTREEAERWLASETSLAAMINEDLQYLDYVADPKYKAIKDNSDYPQGTVDFNNICRKRVPFTRMFTRLQRRYPNRVFTADELADIRTIMSQDDLMVACGLCYVEDRRQMVGEVAQSFIDGLQDKFKTYANNPTKKKNAKKFNELAAGDTYVPQVYDLTTQEGLDKLYKEHRGIWEAFQAFNHARGQQSQNLLQGYAEYKREILLWSDKKVKSVNDNGGLRIFSYSDFEAHHLIDVVQIIIDCAAKGVKIQGYTKVPEFARAVAKTGIKLNRSLIPLGDTGLVDGQLAFDPVEGIDINDPNFLESNDNVGNILIGINDEQIRVAMADPRIHYIIPYHARQKENIRQKLNVGAWTNYISTQNERNISDGKRVKDNINIYTEILNGEITNERQFVEKYLELCAEKGRIPKFDQFLERDAEGNYLYTPGYYKFLVDFKLFDENGNILPQQPVVAEFDDAFNMQILENYAKDERESTGEQMNETYDKIVDALGLGESAAEGEDVRFSLSMESLDKAAKTIRNWTDNGLRGRSFELTLPQDTLAKVRAVMGRDFDSHNITANGVAHALNSHGVGGYNLQESSIPITADYVELIPYIMVAPDYVTKGSTDATGRESVRFYKNLSNGYVVVIEKEYKNSPDDMETINMWAEMSSKATNAQHNAAPGINVQNAILSTDIAKIHKDAESAIERDANIRLSVITPQMDADYLAAVERGDMETAQRMVDEAAEAAGFEQKVYRVDEYSGNRNRYKNVFGGVFYAESLDYFDFSDTGHRREKAKPFFINTTGFFDPMNEMRNLIVNSWGDILGRQSDFEKFDIEDETHEDRGQYNDGEEILVTSTDGLAIAAQRQGYNGVILRDVPQNNGKAFTEFAVYNSNSVKSADPVTYDDAGNVIPLSERFNAEKEDIRFSARTDEMKASVMEEQVMFSAVKPHQSSLAEVTDLFYKWNKDEAVVPIFERVREICEQFDTDFRFVSGKEMRRIAGFGTYGAAWGNKVRYNANAFRFLSDQQNAATLLHEMIHVATVYLMETKETHLLTEDQLQARADIKAILKEVRDTFPNEYAAIDELELIAEMANPAFRNKMKEGNLWERFVNAIRRLFGLEEMSYDRLTPTMDVLNRILETPNEDIKSEMQPKAESYTRFSAVTITPEVREEMDRIAANAIIDGNYMLAPNGRPTKLNADQWALVRTQNFLDWFGDWMNDPENASKVVDPETGEPRMVYHQTNASVYINRETGQNWDELGWKEKMEWDERDDWDEYWEEQDFNTFSRVNARTTNEFDGFFFAPEYDEYHEYGERTIPAFLNIKNPASREDYNIDSSKNDAGRDERIRLQNEGFDGVIRMEGDEVDEYIAFEPNQIKSAVETTGEFSESEDIRYSSRFDVDPNPTEAQKKAGNYKMGHLRIDGYNITIENPKGSVRRGTDSKGNEWENTLNNDYGYIRGTKGVDGDHIDVYLSDNPEEGNVFVVDQVKPDTGEFDEHKVMYGFGSIDEAREAYLANFSEGWNGLGTITEVTKDEFRKWIDSSHRKTKPFSEYKSVKADILDEGDIRYSLVTDPATLERLENEPTIKVYRAMQLIDGKLYPPMSAKVDGKMREPIELGKWEQADERPDLADEKGYFKLDKGNKTSLKARYNPYFHTSPTPLNDQFASAQTRPELVTVEVEVPESELTSGYKAEKAKDSVGQMEWKAGVVQSKLSGTRTVILSRWDKPVRIVPDSEVADRIVEMFEGKDITMPSNVVTPSLRAELEKRGVPFMETNNQGKQVETDIRYSSLSTPTDKIVSDGMKFSIQEFARLAGNIFEALPEAARKEAIEETFKREWDMQSAIFQVPARLAEKESWDESDKELAQIIRDKVQDAMEESGVVMSRPLTSKEALWMLYQSTAANSGSMLDAARKSIVAHNLGFDSKSMTLKQIADDYIRYSVVRGGQIDVATDMYNYEANLWTSRLAESWLDMNQSVISLQNALAKASGKPIESWEDVVLALNQLSSKSYADKKKYMRDFLKPLWDAVMDIVRNTDFKIEDIERYMMLKHGLERNEKFAKRDAKQFYKEMFDKVADRMKNTSHAEQVVALSEAKKRIADIDNEIATAKGKKLKELQEARERAVVEKEIAELVLRGDEKQNEQDLQDYYDNIDNELNQKYWEFREKDYGGLTSMFQEKLHDVKRKDYKTEEAYQKALMASVKPKYDTVAKMEDAARSEVEAFENGRESLSDELWRRINAATKETLRHQHASGVITTEQYDAVRNMFDFYVPLRGFADNTAVDMYSYYMDNSAGGFAKPIIAAKGRKTRAESPLGWIGTMAESAIQQDNKNEAKMKLYYALINRPDTGVLSLSEMWYEFSHKDPATGKKVFVPVYPPATGKALSAEELRQHMDAWEASMKAKQAIGEAYKSEQRVNLRGSVIFQDSNEGKEHIIRVKVAGKDYSILVNGNPRAAQAINGILNPESNVGPVMQWYGELRRGMSALMTSFSPLFWVANYQRDLLSSFMRTSESEGWGQAFRYLGNRWHAWRVAKYVYAYDNDTMGDSYYENLYKEFAENGGITGYTSLTTNKEYEKLLEDYAKHVDQKALNWIKGVWDKFMGFGEAIEQVSRFAAYITAKESGKSIEEAVAAAKEVSVNFNRKGSAQPISLDELDKLRDKNGRPLSIPKKAVAIALSAMPAAMKQLYFFFNASIQALSSSAKLAIKSPGKAVAWAGMYMGMSMGLAAINYMLSGDDDEEEYLDLPDYLRHSTALIKVSDEYYLKWSLPQEMRPFYATADIILSKAMGNMPHKNIGKEIALAMAEWLPVNPFGTEDPLLALVPDVGAPLAEIKANRNSFGGKIYDDMSFKSEEVVKNIPAYRKGTSKTGKIYVDLTELLNDLSGGDEVQKGAINLNPAIMEHLVEGYGGGIYDFAKMMVSLPGLIASDEPLEVRDIPFVNKVLLSTDETNMYSHTNDAFNHYRNVSENAQRVEKEYFTSDDPSRAEAYRQEDDWRIHLLYKQYEEELKDFRERLDKAVDETEIELLREQQNAVREQLLNDIATGTQPDPLFEAKIDMDRKFDELSELRKTIAEASKRGDAEAAEQAQKELEQYVESEDFKRYAELRPYVNAYAKLRKALKETYNADTRQDLENAAKEAKAALDEKLKDF